MGRPSRFSPEVRERAVRLVMEQRGGVAALAGLAWIGS
jgi:transposase-like protein